MKLTNLSVLIVFLLLASCKNSDLKFYGEIVVVEYPERVDTLVGSPILLEGEYTGAMSAYNGLLLFESEKHPDGYLYLYNPETGERINAICRRGDGPDEYISFLFYSGFEKDINGISMWVNDSYKKRIRLINVQGNSIKEINTSEFKNINSYGIGAFYMLNDSLLLAYIQPIEIFENKISAPSYCVFNYETGKIAEEYKFYSNYRVNENTNIGISYAYLGSFNGIKPDKSKLAMAMTFLKRIDILDLTSGKVKSVETTSSPALNAISSGNPISEHYRALKCDEHYIYVMEGTFTQFAGMVNVYDWSGNFLRILRINEDATVFAFDPIYRILYAKNDTEEIMAYDLNFLYK